MKKKLGSIFAIAMTFSLILSTHALAAARDETVSPYAAYHASVTAVDNDGNKYKMTGTCAALGPGASATTSFTTTLYKDGTYSADKKTKTLKASAYVTFGNGAAYSGATGSRNFSNVGSGSYTKSYSGFAYNARTVAGGHTLSCNGGSCTGGSYCS